MLNLGGNTISRWRCTLCLIDDCVPITEQSVVPHANDKCTVYNLHPDNNRLNSQK